MKAIALFLAAGALLAFFPACNTYGPHDGDPGYYSNIHPNQHGRYKEGRRSHAEKKYLRPR